MIKMDVEYAKEQMSKNPKEVRIGKTFVRFIADGSEVKASASKASKISPQLKELMDHAQKVLDENN